MTDEVQSGGVAMPAVFRTLLVDSPWPERGGGKIKRGAQRHYPVLGYTKIPAVILASPLWLPADDAHLYLWATNNHLREALWVMDRVGFRYVTNLCWVKDGKAGLGQYFRGRHEMLLFGVRGKGLNVRTSSRSLTSVMAAPRGLHSVKPEIAYQLIETRSFGPYAELFARRPRAGWHSWGRLVVP